MSSVVVNQIRRGFYLDSVALMRVSRAVASLDGVEDAALMLATPANLRIMRDAGILAPETTEAGGGDLVIAVRARDRVAADEAMAEAERLLSRPGDRSEAAAWQPRTVRQAVRTAPDSNLALISVPGEFALAEARKALGRGLHVMIFSDNVPVDGERALKEEARRAGRLVMGPDCGTAIIAGVPLAFANAVPRGDIGLIGASGTGLQEVSCLIARRGGGVSHAIGVGGRDLSEAVGGITTLMAMDALDADAGTDRVVLISKPPAPAIARRVLDRIAESPKRYVVCFIGAGELQLPENACQADTLKQAAAIADEEAEPDEPDEPLETMTPVARERRRVIGLFSGGTLCAEAQLVFRAAGEQIASNAPLPGVPEPGDAGGGHRLLDLGDDAYTKGRPHPMIDPGVRDGVLREALTDPTVAVVLTDLVLGYGAHPDPGGHLTAVIAEGPLNGPVVVASVTGTDSDPQCRSAQVAKLEAAGVLVAPSNADAAELALACLHPG